MKNRNAATRGLVLLGGGITVLLAVLCQNSGGCAGTSDDAKPPTREVTWRYPDTPLGPSEVVVTIPRVAAESRRMPVLIALHGQGESRKSPSRGARGWSDDYHMLTAMARLANPPLTRRDFGDMVTDARLHRINRSLKKRPYRGIIVVSPYLPDKFGQKRMHQNAAVYGTFLVDDVLPRVRREAPAIKGSAATGIDGVSLGGRVALLAGLRHPSVFGAVGGTQAAFGEKHVAGLTALVKAARKQNPNLSLRIVSSKKDRFLAFTNLFSRALKQANEAHHLDIFEGNHSYEFNRGPGVFEMLIYYDRVLRGEPLWSS